MRCLLKIAVLAVLLLALPGFCQSPCCLSDLNDSLVTIFTMMGMTNVTVGPNSSCSHTSISGEMSSSGMTIEMTMTLQVINGDDLELTTETTVMGQTDTQKDTIPDYCQSAVEQGVAVLPNVFQAFPNPFQGRLQIDFENKFGNALLEVFDVNGVKVDEIRNIHGTRVTWEPGPLKKGVYIVRVRTRDQIHIDRVIYAR